MLVLIKCIQYWLNDWNGYLLTWVDCLTSNTDSTNNNDVRLMKSIGYSVLFCNCMSFINRRISPSWARLLAACCTISQSWPETIWLSSRFRDWFMPGGSLKRFAPSTPPQLCRHLSAVVGPSLTTPNQPFNNNAEILPMNGRLSLKKRLVSIYKMFTHRVHTTIML